MPGYGGTGAATLLRINRQAFLFQREQPASGTASVAVQLDRATGGYPWGSSFEVFFTDVNGNPVTPGAFEVDIQTADIDQDTHFCTINQIVNANLNTNGVGRLELPNFFAKYVRAFMKTSPAGVYVSVMATR